MNGYSVSIDDDTSKQEGESEIDMSDSVAMLSDNNVEEDAADSVPQEPIEIVIVALSSYTEDSMKNKAKLVGMSDYLTKPIKVQVLDEVMKRYVFVQPEPVPQEVPELDVNVEEEKSNSESRSKTDQTSYHFDN